MTAIKMVVLAILALLGLLALSFGLNYAGLMSFSFFAPRVEQVRYNTFKESQTYNDGMVRDLEDLKTQYMTANPDQKVALRAIVIHRFSVYPVDRMPADLQSFYYSLQGGTQ